MPRKATDPWEKSGILRFFWEFSESEVARVFSDFGHFFQGGEVLADLLAERVTPSLGDGLGSDEFGDLRVSGDVDTPITGFERRGLCRLSGFRSVAVEQILPGSLSVASDAAVGADDAVDSWPELPCVDEAVLCSHQDVLASDHFHLDVVRRAAAALAVWAADFRDGAGFVGWPGRRSFEVVLHGCGD